MTFRKFLLALLVCLPITAWADDYPSASPTMTYVDSTGVEVTASEYDGSAPLKASFLANPQNVGDYRAYYEWRFYRSNEQTPFLTRFDEDTDFEFRETGTFHVELRISFVMGTDTIEYVSDTPFSINIRESFLRLPNAFTPNDDGINDEFRVKKNGHQSIVEFEGWIFNRSGRLLYHWTDINAGWDGRSGGRNVPDGAYYLRVKAKGADGRTWDIKKVINLLRGKHEVSQ
ncbi:MAG: gliding motility-associated C-terminal domain-containing protein [Bacteroidaceae bacterium]|nr:gliding motility-associated C-terminal domain-containing protein [Bacteroidaceae bacterium]MDY6249899.1 gliding motility-associated C-terminal domain-containing protein [Bacteroidaceae bacterium]